jgi:cytochrome d ubiquinol oxidase subunit I
LKKFRPDIANATPEQITLAAWSTVPNVSLLFWSFRVMVGLGFYFIALFAVAFLLASKRQLMKYRSFLWAALFSLPLPWLAAELGWIVAEVGRQPWVIEGVLPTFLAISSISAANVWITLIGFVVFYSTLAGSTFTSWSRQSRPDRPKIRQSGFASPSLPNSRRASCWIMRSCG